eukprot:8803875-Pyramimonas_sp.AAC.1
MSPQGVREFSPQCHTQPVWSLAHWQGNSSNYGTGPCPHTSSTLGRLSTARRKLGQPTGKKRGRLSCYALGNVHYHNF